MNVYKLMKIRFNAENIQIVNLMCLSIQLV